MVKIAPIDYPSLPDVEISVQPSRAGSQALYFDSWDGRRDRWGGDLCADSASVRQMEAIVELELAF